MPQYINTNISSLTAQLNLNKSQNSLSTALERLSSGLRINSAKDDAAGLAIASRMTAQIRGLNQAVRNANDGVSLAQTAEGALDETSNALQRIRELALQSANDTNSDSDRINLQKEVSQLVLEINRIADTTTFNGKEILNGSFVDASFQVGAFANQTISVSISSSSGQVLGANTVDTDGTINNAVAAGATVPANTVLGTEDLTISGSLGSETVDTAAGQTAESLVTAINNVQASTGVSASAVTKLSLSSFSTTGTFAFDLIGDDTASISAVVSDTGNLEAVRDAINNFAASTGVSAEFGSTNGELILTHDTGNNISIGSFTDGGTGTVSVQGLNANGTAAGGPVTLNAAGDGSDDSTTVGGSIEFSSASGFSVTSAAAGGLFDATTANASALSSVASIDISSETGAQSAILVVDTALSRISDIRANLGAVQNRFESAISNLGNVSENTTVARGRIEDADFAAETAALTRAQILQQAGISILAQANALPQNVLALLQ